MNKKDLLTVLSVVIIFATVAFVYVKRARFFKNINELSKVVNNGEAIMTLESGPWLLKIYRETSDAGIENHRFVLEDKEQGLREVLLLSEVRKPLPVHLSTLKYRLFNEDLHAGRSMTSVHPNQLTEKDEPNYSHMIEWIENSGNEKSWDAIVTVLSDNSDKILGVLNQGRQKYKKPFSANLTLVDREMDLWRQVFTNSELKDYVFEVRGGASVVAVSAQNPSEVVAIGDVLLGQQGAALYMYSNIPKEVFMNKGYETFRLLQNSQGESLADAYGFSTENLGEVPEP